MLMIIQRVKQAVWRPSLRALRSNRMQNIVAISGGAAKFSRLRRARLKAGGAKPGTREVDHGERAKAVVRRRVVGGTRGNELISEVRTRQGSARQFTRPLAPQKPDLVERKHIRVRKARGQADRMIQTAKFCFYLLQIHRIMK